MSGTSTASSGAGFQPPLSPINAIRKKIANPTIGSAVTNASPAPTLKTVRWPSAGMKRRSAQTINGDAQPRSANAATSQLPGTLPRKTVHNSPNSNVPA
jgi:hypothetical protein